ncbi:MAG: glycerol dehydrogenase [Planctomycetaceae bacterium]|nr:glycerol dehydrogenase [Planctomycetaceae bacterium]
MRKAFISPTKYVQGEDELLYLGYFIKLYGDSAFMVAQDEDLERVEEKLKKTCETFGVTVEKSGFTGKCTKEETDRLQKVAKEKNCACTVALGGGQAVDASKFVAQGEKLIIVPTIAATDSPTSHSAVLYTEDGFFDEYAYFKSSPSVILIDTKVIAEAPTRFLISGIGDALSTYFEARATSRSFSDVNAGLPCGAREGKAPPAKSTKTALALAKLCYDTIREDAGKAIAACEAGVVTQALENIIEANVLLSGIGFESGGLAAAHAIHDGFTVLEATHDCQHGEKVAFGTICQLLLENAPEEELYEVIEFCAELGLPICLEDIGLDDPSEEDLRKIAEKACEPEESIHSMPFTVTEDMVVAAILAADTIGMQVKGALGESGCGCGCGDDFIDDDDDDKSDEDDT